VETKKFITIENTSVFSLTLSKTNYFSFKSAACMYAYANNLIVQ